MLQIEILGPDLIKQQQQEIMESIDGQPTESKTVIAIQPVSILPNVIELAYYSNTVVLHYLMDSVVITALYATLKSQINNPKAIAENNIIIPQNVLIENAVTVCDILKYEFIFCKPCQSLEEVISHAIDNILMTGIIFRIEVKIYKVFHNC
jgi:glycerol-3-phosphate O-acyltransferase 1/2